MAGVKCFTDNEGKRMVLTDDDETIVLRPCAAAAGWACDPSRCAHALALATALTPNNTHRFDPMKATVGDLVGKNVNDSRMRIDASALTDLSRPLGVVQAMISSKPFDPTLPTIGDLVGKTALSVRGHTSLRTISIEPGDYLVHPNRIRTCSR